MYLRNLPSGDNHTYEYNDANYTSNNSLPTT